MAGVHLSPIWHIEFHVLLGSQKREDSLINYRHESTGDRFNKLQKSPEHSI